MKPFLALLFIFCAYVYASNAEYEDKKAMAQEQRTLNQGRIYSRKCEKKGMDVMATKADKGPWVIHCIERRTLKV